MLGQFQQKHWPNIGKPAEFSPAGQYWHDVGQPSSYQHWTNKGQHLISLVGQCQPNNGFMWFYVQYIYVSDEENYKLALIDFN